MNRVTMVSADSHVGLPPEEYESYLDPRFRKYFEWYLDDNRAFQVALRQAGFPFAPEVLDVIDDRGAISGGGYAGFFDPKRRLRVVEAEGVAAEILHPAGPISMPPFCDSTSRPVSHELRSAGSDAYNRFLLDFCSESPQRLLGVALTYPWPDIDGAVRTVHWAADHHMVAVYPPRFAGADLPAFADPSWDPLWAACAETGIVLHIHAGTGRPQGYGRGLGTDISTRLSRAEHRAEHKVAIAQLFEDTFEERRPLWQLIWSGAFDRYPDLKVVFAEIRAEWIPPTLAYLDERYHEFKDRRPKLMPSEYWARNCAVTASFMRPSDLATQDVLGGDHIMFGTDYPHAESTWPNTIDFLRVVLAGASERELRAVLGENAIRFYGLDDDLLSRVAARIGVLPTDILGQSASVSDELIDHFADRNGLHKVPQFELARLEHAFRSEVAPYGRAGSSLRRS